MTDQDARAWISNAYDAATADFQSIVTLVEFQEFFEQRSLAPAEVRDKSELFLVCACCAGNEVALARFRSLYVDPIQSLRGLHLTRDELGEAKQRAMSNLLVPGQEGQIKLRRYGGLGNIGTLVRVVVAREALNAKRKEKRFSHIHHASAVSDASSDEMRNEVNPLRTLRRAEQESVLKTALGRSLKALSPQDQNLLRMRIKDGVTLESLATIHRVHKTTIVRRMLKARAALFTKVQATLREITGMGETEVRDFALSMNSQMNLSLSRLFDSEGSVDEHRIR